MEYLIGVILGLAVASAGRFIGLDGGRAFYPTVLIVVASYYALFAAMGASGPTLGIEIAIGLGFAVMAAVGFRRNMWLVAAGIAGHGIFDLFHHLMIENPGTPVWWPGFCASVDLVLGGWLAFCLFFSSDVETGRSAPTTP